MKPTAQDHRQIVEWSEEDGCFIGSAPPLIGPCCHGDTEEDVYRQLAVIVDEWVGIYKKEGFKLPPSSKEA